MSIHLIRVQHRETGTISALIVTIGNFRFFQHSPAVPDIGIPEATVMRSIQHPEMSEKLRTWRDLVALDHMEVQNFDTAMMFSYFGISELDEMRGDAPPSF